MLVKHSLFSLDKHAQEHIQERIRSLFLFDEVRIMELLESIQFGLGYLIIGFFAGTVADYSFPRYKEEITTKELFFEVLLQSIILILLIFYVRKIVKIMPFAFVLNISGDGKANKYRPYEVSEYGGEVMIEIAILGAQFNLLKKLDLLSRRLYKWIYNEEKEVGHSLGL